MKIIKKTLFFGLALSTLSLHGMEMNIQESKMEIDEQEKDIEIKGQREGEEIHSFNQMPNELLTHIVSYLTGLRESQELNEGLIKAREDIKSLHLINKHLRNFLDITNKKSWFHGNYKCKQCQENAYVTAYYNDLLEHTRINHSSITSSAAFSQDGKYVLTTNANGTVTYWNLTDPNNIRAEVGQR
jgi:WD40 repeat protein